MKYNSIVVAILTLGVMLGAPALAGGDNDNNGQGNNCQGNSCGGGSNNGGNGGNGGNSNVTTNNTNRNTNRNTQGQLQGQGQAQGQAVIGSGNSAQGQSQAVTGSGNSAQGQSQGLTNTNGATNGGQANAQSSSFVNNNTNAYLPERINPMPTIDYGNVRVGDVACPVPGILGGVSYSDGSYGFDGYGAGSDVTATLGFQIPLGVDGCRQEQARVRTERARVDSFNLIRQCLAIQQTGVKLDPSVFPEFSKCEGVNPVLVQAPVK